MVRLLLGLKAVDVIVALRLSLSLVVEVNALVGVVAHPLVEVVVYPLLEAEVGYLVEFEDVLLLVYCLLEVHEVGVDVHPGEVAVHHGEDYVHQGKVLVHHWEVDVHHGEEYVHPGEVLHILVEGMVMYPLVHVVDNLLEGEGEKCPLLGPDSHYRLLVDWGEGWGGVGLLYSYDLL